MTPNEAVIAAMRRLRRERGWTRAELAERWGVTVNVVTNLENGRKGREFTVNEAVSLAGVLDIPFGDLVGPALAEPGTEGKA